MSGAVERAASVIVRKEKYVRVYKLEGI